MISLVGPRFWQDHYLGGSSGEDDQLFRAARMGKEDRLLIVINLRLFRTLCPCIKMLYFPGLQP